MKFFESVFEYSYASAISVEAFLMCLGTALGLGVIIAFAYAFRSRFTRSFLLTLGILPGVVSVVIMMVNGQVGAGIAVAGAFSLVRFRSAPGSAKEIAAIFLAMSAGLACGMGYLGFASLFSVIMAVLLAAYNLVSSLTEHSPTTRKSVKITIPEDLDYTDIFDDIFKKYTKSHQLVMVKSINLGSMFRLTYNLTLRDAKSEKQFIDELRQRNGNLEITVSREENVTGEL